MIYQYNKLVRDKIPHNIDCVKGRKATWRIMEEEEYQEELNKKLLEETHEFIEENNIEELADIMEVIESIMKIKNITWEQIREKQKWKREKKGGFEDKIYLAFVEQENIDRREEEELKKSWRKSLEIRDK